MSVGMHVFLLAASSETWHSWPMIIACVNQKGGVGKTTVAVHLACWLRLQEHRVALLDCDVQATAARWLHRTQVDLPATLAHDADAIIEVATKLDAERDFVVADGAAGLSDCTRAILLVADLAVLPCGATVPELEATGATVRMLRNAQRVRGGTAPGGLIALTRLRHRGCRLVREAPRAAACFNLPVSAATLTLREALADAPGQGRLVWELGCRAKSAADEMVTLCEEIFDHARRPTNILGDPYGRTTGVPARRGAASPAGPSVLASTDQ